MVGEQRRLGCLGEGLEQSVDGGGGGAVVAAGWESCHGFPHSYPLLDLNPIPQNIHVIKLHDQHFIFPYPHNTR